MNATTLAPVAAVTATVPSTDGPVELVDLRRSVRSLGEALAEVPWADPRWRPLGASVSAVADLIRRSVGDRGATTASEDLAPIVRLRDLAVAGRALLGRGVTIIDPEAARDARNSCAGILTALARPVLHEIVPAEAVATGNVPDRWPTATRDGGIEEGGRPLLGSGLASPSEAAT